MTAFTNMQMTMQEEDNLLNLAVQAFYNAFKQVSESSAVVFAKDHQLIERLPSGKINVIKDISAAYISIAATPKVLKPKKYRLSSRCDSLAFVCLLDLMVLLKVP